MPEPKVVSMKTARAAKSLVGRGGSKRNTARSAKGRKANVRTLERKGLMEGSEDVAGGRRLKRTVKPRVKKNEAKIEESRKNLGTAKGRRKTKDRLARIRKQEAAAQKRRISRIGY